MGRRVWLLVAVAMVSMVALGTGGFGATTMDRPVSVPIVDDPSEGFVGILGPDGPVVLDYGSNDPKGRDPGATGHRSPTLLTLQNNLDSTVTYEVDVRGDEPTPPDLQGQPYFVDSGDARTVAERGGVVDLKASIVCAAQESETWTVHVVVEQGGFEGTVDHEVTVVCDGPPGQGHEPNTVDGGPGNSNDGSSREG